ncbi:MAG: zinc-ribbon domain [Clostridiales bacterium]|nr:zinc-ribbon domain [Clostridiales bacterium]
MNFCVKCGFQISEGEVFCGNCGARGSENSNQKTVSFISNCSMSNEEEKELYKKHLIGYYTGLKQITGTFLITNKKISYKPLPIHILKKEFSLDLNEILDAERASVLGMNLCIRVTTTSGKSHLFGFGIINKNDIQMVVDLINNVKQGGRK